jgi:murein DD-endopeptidase MepM/ murein hydrolase activator NlpD
VANYRKVAARKARKYHINPALFVAQINAESHFNPGVTSPAGAQGIAQFMPGTAAGMHVDPWRPKEALDGAARLMSSYVKKFGSYEKALRAYNAGSAGVQASYGYPETNAYVKSILAHRGDSVPGGKGPMVDAIRQRASGKTNINFQPASFDQSTQIDQAGYEKARKQAVLGAFLAQRRPNSLLARLLPQQMPSIADFTKTAENFNPAQVNMTTTPGKTPRASAQASTGIVKGAKPGVPVKRETSVGGVHETSGLAGFPARDYFAPAGSAVVAPITGKVYKESGYDPKLGAVQGAGGPLGWSVYILGKNGKRYYLTHMGSRFVKVGQRVKQGQKIGTVANYDKYGRPSHIHMGISG